MLRSLVEEECPIDYSVCWSTMCLFNYLRKHFGSSLSECQIEEAPTGTARKKITVKDLFRGDLRKLSSEELSALHKLYLDNVKPRAKQYSWTKTPLRSESMSSLFRNRRDKKDYEKLSLSLNLLVLKSSKKVVLKDLYFFTDKYNLVEVEGATKFLQGIKKKMDKGSEEDKRKLEILLNAAVQNLHLYSLCRHKMSSCCDKLKIPGDRARQWNFPAAKIHPQYAAIGIATRAAFFRTMGLPGTSEQDVLDALSRYCASCAAPCQLMFPVDSLLAVVEADASLNVNFKEIQKNLLMQVNQFDRIEYSKNLLERVSRSGEEGPVSGLYVKAVEDLNLYCLTNGIDLDVNKTFNIEPPTRSDVIIFLQDHEVGLENENLIRAFLSTTGHPNSNSHAIAKAMRQTPNEFGQNLADRQVPGDRIEADLMKTISACVIRNKVYSNIELALEPNRQRITEFLDTNAFQIPYMGEQSLLNLLALVGRFEDEIILNACRLALPKWFTKPPPTMAADFGRREIYNKGVYNVFQAWWELNKRPTSKRPQDRLFSTSFLCKLVEQSAKNYSEALVSGIQKFCVLHEVVNSRNFLQPFFIENNHTWKFLDSNWDKLQSNINIFRSLNILVTAGLPGTDDSEIVKKINCRAVLNLPKNHVNSEAVNLSKQLLIVAAATNQLDKLKVLKDPKEADYLETFQSLVSQIINSENATDVALTKSERISEAMRQLKNNWFARALKLPMFEELEWFLGTNIVKKIGGQADPLGFLHEFGNGKIERSGDKIKRLANLHTVPVDHSAPCGKFDYLLATHKLVDSMQQAKLPSSMFKVQDFPDLRYRDPKLILFFDELIGEYEVHKADKLLAGIYKFMNKSLPQHFVEAADAVNLLCLSIGGLSINESKWLDHEISDESVTEFMREADIPEEIAKDEKLMKDFLLFHKLMDNKESIIGAMQLRKKCAEYRAGLQEARIKLQAKVESDIENYTKVDDGYSETTTGNDLNDGYSESTTGKDSNDGYSESTTGKDSNDGQSQINQSR